MFQKLKNLLIIEKSKLINYIYSIQLSINERINKSKERRYKV